MIEDRLGVHLDTVYRVAQAVTLDPQAAAPLVERAYRNAYEDRPETWPEDEVRERLIRHVLDAHAATTGTVPAPEVLTDTAAHGVPTRGPFRARVARETIDRLLPTALALLPERLRTLLVLMETENLAAPDAARLFGIPTDQVQREREEATRLLGDLLIRSASEVEREVLREHLREDWAHQGLLRHARTRFDPPPPTLALPRPRTAAVGMPSRAEAGPRDSPRRGAVSGRPRRFLLAVLVVFGAGLIGLVASTLLEPKPDANVVTLSARKSEGIRVERASTSASEIQSYLLNEKDVRVRVPEISGAALLGAGDAEMHQDVRVPVLIYRDTLSDVVFHVFVYSYAMLDRNGDRLALERDVMEQIEDESHFDLHDLGETRVLIWRDRDEIFVAVTRGDATELQERIRSSS